MQIHARVARHLRAGIRRHLGAEIHRATRVRECCDKGVVPLRERDPLPVRRRNDLHGVVGLEVDLLLAAHQVDAGEHELLAAALAKEDSRAGAVELRLEAALAHELRRAAAVGRHDVEAGVLTEGAPANDVAAGGAVDHELPVRRERGLGVVAWLGDDVPARSAAGRADVKATRISIAPRGVHDLLRVARPRGMELEHRIARQPLRCSCGQRPHVHVAERVVGHGRSVGRDVDIAKHAHRELLRVNVLWKHEALVGRLLDASTKRDLDAPRRRHVHAPDPAFSPDNDVGAVRSPAVLAVDAVDGPRLLHIAIEPVEDTPLFATLEVSDEQRRLAADTPNERQPLPVGRYTRRDRAASLRYRSPLLAVCQVAANDRVDDAVRVLVVFERLPRCDVLAVVEIPPIRGGRGFSGVLLPAVLLGHLQAVGAAHVEHPDLTGADRSLLDEMAAAVEELAIRRPCRAVHIPLLLLRHLMRSAAVRLHDPKIHQAIAVGRERNPLPIGAEPRLHVERRAAREALGEAGRRSLRLAWRKDLRGDRRRGACRRDSRRRRSRCPRSSRIRPSSPVRAAG